MTGPSVIPYGRQDISEADVQAVVEALRSDFLTQGPVVPRFEAAVAAHCGGSTAVAMNSATSALHVACLALGVGPGDEVWTSPVTFVASANCALYCGAAVDFVDIDPRTYNLSVEALAAKLERADREGRLPKVVIPVHLAGQSCDMLGVHALARRYGFRVIEDASHAVGGSYQGRPIGDCRYSDITVFSFHPVKIVTTAEGGVAMTNDSRLAERMRLLRAHGITRDPAAMSAPAEGAWYYEQVDLGFNYRMTELQGALGESQMRRLGEFVARRHVLARRYDEALAALPVRRPWQHPDSHSALHLYVIRVDATQAGRSRRQVFDALRTAGIGVNVHYIPVYRQPYYRGLGVAFDDCPNADQYYEEAISLPMYAALSETDQERTIDALAAALGATVGG